MRCDIIYSLCTYFTMYHLRYLYEGFLLVLTFSCLQLLADVLAPVLGQVTHERCVSLDAALFIVLFASALGNFFPTAFLCIQLNQFLNDLQKSFILQMLSIFTLFLINREYPQEFRVITGKLLERRTFSRIYYYDIFSIRISTT